MIVFIILLLLQNDIKFSDYNVSFILFFLQYYLFVVYSI